MFGAKFVSQMDFKNHIKSFHEGNKQHNCKKCNAAFVIKIDFGNYNALDHERNKAKRL